MIPHLFHDFIIFQIRMKKKGGRHINPVIVQIVLEGYAAGFPEQLSQVGAVDNIFLPQILQGQIFRLMLLDILFHVAHDASPDIFAAKLGEIIRIFLGKTFQMHTAATHRAGIKGVPVDKFQNFLLVYVGILGLRHVYKLKQKIIYIQADQFGIQAVPVDILV